LLRQEKGQVGLHFHNQYNLFFYLKFTPKHIREKTKIIYTVHSYIWQGNWEEIKEAVQSRYFQEIYCCRNADKVFVLNEATQQHFVEHLGIDQNRIQLIANGVNTEVYYPMDEEERKSIKQKLGFEGKTVFFQAGSVCERKNQLASLQLLLPLMQKDENIVFVYAGGIISPAYKMAIDALAASSGLGNRVIYTGELTPGKILNEYYNISQAFIFPSTSEGFSLVILEAMSAGLQVLVDAGSGLQLPDGGHSGCFSYVDETDFRTKVTGLLDPANESLSRINTRQCIEQNYSWDSVAKDYIAGILD
jgi:glycosyltransferase involved in cell wall biosynthesis